MGKDKQAEEDEHSLLDEEALLESICDFELDDVAFEGWKNVHSSLDVTVEIELRDSDLKNPDLRHPVSFCRTTSEYRDGVLESLEKEKVSLNIHVPSDHQSGQPIVLEGLGDKGPEGIGDLRVIVRIIN